jgi:phenylalanyl-tRNA synthetase alpha chain
MLDAGAIAHLREAFVGEVSRATSARDLQAVRDRYLGRKGGLVSALFADLAKAPPEVKRELGALVNELKQFAEAELEARRAVLEATKPAGPRVDLTLPGRTPRLGHRHPLNFVRERVEAIFERMGYEVLDGPETEDDYHNFEALNMPADHPARDMQDTLYLDPAAPFHRAIRPVGAARAGLLREGGNSFGKGSPGKGGAGRKTGQRTSAEPSAEPPATLLRTHTSSMQIRYMQRHEPPVRVIAPGRVYRRDSLDLTHTPMFQQVEGLVVGEGISMADLKGTLIGFLRELFDADTKVMFRPSFFPYTEPSAEVFIGCRACGGTGCPMCKRTGWLEILGSGMVHPAVFEAVGYDPERYTGFAFGMGVERLALLMFGIDDIRQLYDNDLRLLEQFPH